MSNFSEAVLSFISKVPVDDFGEDWLNMTNNNFEKMQSAKSKPPLPKSDDSNSA